MEIVVNESEFNGGDGAPLKAITYRGNSASDWWLIDIHGGAWSSGSRHSGEYYNRALAARGFNITAIDFRDGRNARHPAACEDIAAAVAHVRATETPGHLGLIGSSSGGHLALLAALQPMPAKNAGIPIELLEVDCAIALWPVSNPLERFQYASFWRYQPRDTWGPMFSPDRLAEGQLAYFGNEAMMGEAAIQQVLRTGSFTFRPAVFIAQPARDLNVPVLMSESLAGALTLQEIDVDYRLYDDVAHGFAHVAGPQTDRCINDIVAFLTRVGASHR